MQNGFDHDLTSRSEVKIVEVVTPLPDTLNPANPQKPAQPSPAFTPDTVKAYEKALARARSQGRHVSTILVCNPHVSSSSSSNDNATSPACPY